MSTPADKPINATEIPPLTTPSALRERHSELLRRHREGSDRQALFADVMAFIRAGRDAGALMPGDDERREAQALLDYWANRAYGEGFQPPDAILAPFDPVRAPQLPDSLCPYVGLDAFREENHRHFFGRERLLTEMTKRLSTERFLAVVGSSGSGKSSLVLGGVVPCLKAGAVPRSEHWRYLQRALVPGSDPLSGLARLLHDSIAPDDPTPIAEWVARQTDGFRARPGHLAQLLEEASPVPLLLVVDQFEEVFTLSTNEEARSAFIANLVYLAQSPGAPHHVLLTMRIDFEDHVLRYPDLNRLFERGRVDVKALTADEMREAIHAPARAIGLEFEQGVVADLVRDVLGEPAGLPLLQFALRTLWSQRRSKWITREAYAALGGARQALAHGADAFYEGLLPEDQQTMKLILLRLVRTSEGLEVFNNRVPRESLYVAAVSRDKIDNMLPRLAQAGLVRLTGEAPDEQVEIAHEALIRNWPRFGTWLDNDRANLTVRRRLDTKAAEWVRLGRSEAGLLDIVQLAEAEDWLASDEARLLGYHEALPDLVTCSRAAIEAMEQEAVRQVQVQAAAEEQKRRAEVEARTADVFRRLSIVLGVVFLLAAGVAVYAGYQRRQASANESRANQQAKLAADRAQQAEKEKKTAIAAQKLAQRESIRAQAAEGRTREAAKRATANAQHATIEKIRADKQREIAVSQRAEAEAQRRIAETQSKIALSYELAANSLLHSDTDLSVLLASEAVEVDPTDQAIQVLRRSLSYGRNVWNEQRSHVFQVTLSPDSELVAGWTSDGEPQVWEANTGVLKATLRGRQDDMGLTFSPDSKLVAACTGEGVLQVWKADTGNTIPIEPPGRVFEVIFSPDSKLVAASASGSELQVWEANTGVLKATLHGFQSVRDLIFSPDSKLAAVTSRGGVQVWEANTGVLKATLHGSQSVRDLIFSPDSKLAAARTDGEVQAWKADTGAPMYLGAFEGVVKGLIFSPDSKMVAARTDGEVQVWNADTGAPEATLRGFQGGVEGLIFSPDSKFVAAWASLGEVRVWKAGTGAPEATLRGLQGTVMGLIFSPDDKLLTARTDSPEVRIYSLSIMSASIPELLKEARLTAKRSLTSAERVTYLHEIPHGSRPRRSAR